MSRPVYLHATIFAEQRKATVRKSSRNWLIEWDGLRTVTTVPLSMAVCAQEAAHKAAGNIEGKPWGAFLACRIRELREYEGATSTERAKWVLAKAEGRPYDRHDQMPAGHVMHRYNEVLAEVA